MRPVRPGVYEPDLQAVARVRRRIASDEAQPVEWKRRMLKLCDELQAGLTDVITLKALALGPSGDRPARKPSKKKAEARSSSGS